MRSVSRFAVFAALVVAACNDTDPITTPPTTLTPPRPSADVASGAGAPQVALGSKTSCALRAEGSAACWGSNLYGAASPPTVGFTQVGSGYANACGVTPAGAIICWGGNGWGQGSPPAPPAGLTYRYVSPGSTASCGIRSDGSIGCWGRLFAVTREMPGGVYQQLSVGDFHACAISTTGALACWGVDVEGNLFDKPAAPIGRKFTQVSAGSAHSCAVVDDGTIKCWGNNNYGQISVPALASGLQYKKVSVSRSVADPTQTDFHTCALRSDGTIGCWGSNQKNQLAVPALPAGTTYTDLDVGEGQSCAVRSDGVVACWGLNTSGETNAPGTLNLLKRTQPIEFTPPVPASAATGTTLGLVPNVGSGSPVVLNITTPGTCTATGTTVSFVALGSCTFTADRAGNDQYEPAPRRVVTVTVVSESQTIVFTSTAPSPALPAMMYAVSATGGASGNPVTFSSLTAGTCSVSGGSVLFLGGGDCTVAANQAGNDTYAVAPQVTQTIVVTRWPQTITFAPAPPATAALGSVLGLNATGGASGNPVSFTVGTPATCSLAPGQLTLTSIGTCTVNAYQAGDGMYNETRAQITITVVWPFTGFAGLAAEPAVNPVRAGSSVPLTFSLGGNRGGNVLAAGSPTVAPYVCTGTLPAAGSGTALPLANNGALAYSTKTGQYTITWKPQKREQDCRLVSIRLTDGTVHTARFQLQ